MSKFAHDNHVFFEFYSNMCYVKSQVSRETLLQGKLRDGLYVFEDVSMQNPSTTPTILHTFCNSLSSIFPLWHKKLATPLKNLLILYLQSVINPYL